MSYLVLARKYRPKTFSEMVGQEHVLKALINALESGHLHHAYLFTGTRGVGKTTVARIFAKCLNNDSGISARPDLGSEIAQEIDRGSFVDLIEVDAASRTKVDQTRELLENIHYPPSQGRFRVYLIDEVHMLSTHSFNALLKTLEEPPEHVKFLLATTDPQKLPVTIVSRCLQFHLKQIPEELIEQQLAKVLDEEKITHDPQALQLLSRAGKGSLRDALSITDQAIAYTNSQILGDEIASFLGITDRDQFQALVHAVLSGEAKSVLQSIHRLSEFLPDFQNLLDDFLLHLQQAAIVQQVPDFRFSDHEDTNLIEQIAQTLSPESVQLYYQIALRGKRELDLVVNERAGLEMIFLRMLAFAPAKNAQQATIVQQPVAQQEQRQPEKPQLEKPQQQTEPSVEIKDKLVHLCNDDWLDLYNSLKLDGFSRQIIGHAELLSYTDQRVVFLLGKKHNDLMMPEYRKDIKKALTALFALDTLQVVYEVQEGAPENSPEEQKKQRKKDGKQQIEDQLKQDPEVNALMEQFDAKVVKTTVVDPGAQQE